MCSRNPQNNNGIIVEYNSTIKHTVGERTVLEHSCSRRPPLELSISANTLVASTKRDHIVLPCTIASKETLFNTFAMADCGATASFIDCLFAQLYGLKLSPLQHPQNLTVADGRPVSLRTITHTVRIAFALGARAHRKTLKLFVTTLGQYPVVLGLPWLQKHDPCIWFKDNIITFNSKHCLEHCNATHQAMTICGADNTFNTLHKTPQTHKTHKTPQTYETHETHRSTATP